MVDVILGIQECSIKSHRLNSVINTFIELEKLKLSEKKCNIVHVGNKRENCPNLKVNEERMKNYNQETYLDDKIDKGGRIQPTINGYGTNSNILANINEIPMANAFHICCNK